MDVLDNLTPSQIEAVTHVDGPLLVLAGAGSGKTRVITRRIAHLIRQGIPAWQILAITFTNKAAGEMRERTEALTAGGRRPLVTTFHSFCARMLREYGESLGLDPTYNIYDTSEQEAAVKQALARLNLDATHFAPSRVLDTISRAKNRLQRPTDFTAQAAKGDVPAGSFWAKNVAGIYEAYDALLRLSHALDFDDLLMEVALGLRDRPEFRDLLRDRFHYILIDEYQDTNHAQYVIARDLAGDRRNLCATGDPDQSIYGWRGAEISNILDFEKDFPDAHVVRLEQNYRSTQTILRAASGLIAHNTDRKKKGLFTENAVGDRVRLVETDDESAEAASIADRIQALHDGGMPYRDAAVFIRTVAQTRALEDAFRQTRPPIPYEVLRGTSFYDRKEVRDILAYLQVLHNPNDEASLRRIINTPPRGIGDKTIDALADWARREGISLYHALPHVADVADLPTRGRAALAAFRQLMDRLAAAPRESTADLVETVVNESGYRGALTGDDARDRAANLDELVTLGANFDRAATEADPDDTSVPRGLEGFLESIHLSSDQDGYDEGADRVPLMTLHTAKGLEFPAVFVAGCEEGLLPHERSSESRKEIEEERRLLFVGMTRAKQHLTLLHARYRQIRGQLTRRVLSPFLVEIPSDTLTTVDETTGTRPEMFDRPLPGRRGPPPTRRTPSPTGGYSAPGPDRRTAAERDHTTGLAVSEMVRHPTYGLGRVTGFMTSGQSRFVRVRFNTVGEKMLDPTFAKLEKVSPA